MSTADGQKTPDEIRAEIERTRAGLGYDVDALADKVNPTSIAHRQTDKVKNRFASVKESVMGSAHDGSGSVSGTASNTAAAAQDAGHQAVEKAKGNALAVGLIAFGAGALLASLLPASDKEQELASRAKDKAAPAVDAAKGAAQDVAQNLKEPAQDAVSSVKNTAQEAVGTVKGDAQSAAGDVADSAQQSKDTVQGS
ncbi:DUF3618 domain-containing protein (plasmid) [Frigoribacterium sp. NBH87]|uniref:DUF3618 domain-containing protein n=1 Tax=Frigoribacterium sp. NBH87 TaxID=2596916 RepID=UPI0016249590|nr:DUF3618 domain-containing protein [Frigoribacterium sp. NBH87]QNE45391.1 DUF3618 domain-containing protein [Frigoribacterium sp. NBH87]